MPQRIKQTLPKGIIDDDLEYLKVIGTGEVINKTLKYMLRIAPLLEFSYDDLLEFIGLRDKTPENILTQAVDWSGFSEEEKAVKIEADPDLNVKELENIISMQEQRNKNLLMLPYQMAKVWGIYGYDEEGTITWVLQELYDIISMATGVDFKIIKSTDYYIIAEIFIRIFLKPRESFRQGFFLRTILGILNEFTPIYTSMIRGLTNKLMIQLKNSQKQD